MPLSREILDEDLQIMRVTLTAISDDMRHYSAASAAALLEAIEKVNQAYREFRGPPVSGAGPK